jgi:hypothetical protein
MISSEQVDELVEAAHKALLSAVKKGEAWAVEKALQLEDARYWRDQQEAQIAYAREHPSTYPYGLPGTPYPVIGQGYASVPDVSIAVPDAPSQENVPDGEIHTGLTEDGRGSRRSA